MAADRGMGPPNPKAAEKTFARALKIAKKLPSVEGGVTHGSKDFRAFGKSLGGVRSDGQLLLICTDHGAKEFRLETQPDVFWQAPHYVGSTWLIVRPEKISDADLFAILEAAWRMRAPRKALAEYDAKAPAKPAPKAKKAARKSTVKPAAAPRASKDHFARVVKLVGKLPNIDVGKSYGTPGIRGNKKFLCRLKEDGESLVVLTANLDEKEFLMETDPKVFYETPHYHGHTGVLVHLSKIDDKRLFNLLEASWKRSASKKTLAAYEGQPKKTK